MNASVYYISFISSAVHWFLYVEQDLFCFCLFCFVGFFWGGVSFKPGKQQLYFECLSCVICKMLCFDVLYMALCVTLLNKSVCNMLNYIGREFYFVAYGCFYNIYSTGVYKSLLQII